MAPANDESKLEASNEGSEDENEEGGSNDGDADNEVDSNEGDDQNEDDDENGGDDIEEDEEDGNEDSAEANDTSEEDAPKEGDSVEEVAVEEGDGDDLDTIEMTLATDEFAELKESTVDTSSENQDSKPKSRFACSICKEMCKRASKMKCCGKKAGSACRACAIKHVTGNRKCWNCGTSANTSDVINDEELRAKVDKHHKDNKAFMEGLSTGELLKCVVCQEICKRGVTMPCCGVAACRGCATKKITGSRGCWMECCGQAGVKTEELVNDMVLREAIDGFKKDGVVNEELAREIKDKRDEMNPQLIKAKEEERKKKMEEIKKKRKESFETKKKALVLKRLDEKEARKAQINEKRNGVKGKPAEKVSSKRPIDLRSKLKTKPIMGPSKDRPIPSKNRQIPSLKRPNSNRLKPDHPALTRTVNRKRSHSPLQSNDFHNGAAFLGGPDFGQGPIQRSMGGPRLSLEEQTKMELMSKIKEYREALIQMGAFDDMPKKQKFMPGSQDGGYNQRDSGRERMNPGDSGRGKLAKRWPLLADSGNSSWENRKDHRKERMPHNEPDFRKSWGHERERDAERGRMPPRNRSKDRNQDMERDMESRYGKGRETSFSKTRDAGWEDRRRSRDHEAPKELASREDKGLEKLRREVMKLREELKDSQSSRKSYERELARRESPRKSQGRELRRDSLKRDVHRDHGRQNRDDHRDHGRHGREDNFLQRYPKDNGNIWKDTGRDADPWREEGGMGGAMRERDTRDAYPSMDMDRNREPDRYPLPWDKQSKYPTSGGELIKSPRDSSRQDIFSSREEIMSRQEMTTKQFEVDPWVGNNSAGMSGKDLDLRSAPTSAPMNSYSRAPGNKSVFGLPPPVPAPYNRPGQTTASFPKQDSSMYEKLSREIDSHMSMVRSNTQYDSMSSRYEPGPKATSGYGYKTAPKDSSEFGSGYDPTPKASSGYDASKWGYDAPKSSSFFDELKSREPRLALLDDPRYGGSSRKDIPSLMDQPVGYGGSSADAYGGVSSFGISSYSAAKPQRRF